VNGTLLLLAALLLPPIAAARAVRAPAAVRERHRARYRLGAVASLGAVTAVVAGARSWVPWAMSLPAYWYLCVAGWAAATGATVWAVVQLDERRPPRAVSALCAVVLALAALVVVLSSG
jgi:uncharacterized membrane protein